MTAKRSGSMHTLGPPHVDLTVCPHVAIALSEGGKQLASNIRENPDWLRPSYRRPKTPTGYINLPLDTRVVELEYVPWLGAESGWGRFANNCS